jgi:ribosomal protein L11 methyltransferase
METFTAVKSGLISLKETEKEFELGSLEVTMKNIKEEDWANNWKKYFKPFAIGNRIMIKPSWEELTEETDKVILKIDPGHIFGTGTHETTQCCIEHIENYVKEGDKVLDVGCGSGILSIASLLLGARYAAAVDIDPNAIEIVTQNAKMNDMEDDRYDVYAGNILEDEKFISTFGGKTYNVVEANIVADIIIALSPMVPNFIKDNGIFICSGIISERYDDVVAALTANGFKELETKRKKDWVAIASQYVGK